MRQGRKVQYRSCKFCGKIHAVGVACTRKPKQKRKDDEAKHLRASQAWREKSEEIRERDHYLCQLCIRGIPFDGETTHSQMNVRYTYDELEVHHAVPIAEDPEKWLNDDNLITTCRAHHEAMEKGQIPIELVRRIISEQETEKAKEERSDAGEDAGRVSPQGAGGGKS